VDAMLCGNASDWRWSSVHAHLRGEDDALATVEPMLERFPDWSRYLSGASDTDAIKNIRDNAKCGRPVGDAAFVDELEAVTGRRIRKKKPGPPRRDNDEQGIKR
jgi:putative transposase